MKTELLLSVSKTLDQLNGDWTCTFCIQDTVSIKWRLDLYFLYPRHWITDIFINKDGWIVRRKIQFWIKIIEVQCCRWYSVWRTFEKDPRNSKITKDSNKECLIRRRRNFIKNWNKSVSMYPSKALAMSFDTTKTDKVSFHIQHCAGNHHFFR